MTYTDYYLRFESREAFQTLGLGNGFTMAVDEVGRVETRPAVLDESGDVVSAPEYADGWYVNVRCIGKLPSALDPFVIDAHEFRVWA